MRRSLVKSSLVAVAMIAAVVSPTRADAATDPMFCLRAHVAGVGWQNWQCAKATGSTIVIGTTGQNRAIEAVEAQAIGFAICLRGHLRNIGWQNAQCTSARNVVARAGTTGQAIPMEALTVSVVDTTSAGSRWVSGLGHVQNIGWSTSWTPLAKSATVGTTGRGLNLEAAKIYIR